MVNRRELLRTAGSISGLGLAVSISGCTDVLDDGSESSGDGGGSDGGSDDSGGADGSDDGNESGEMAAAEELATARERIGGLADSLAEIARVDDVELEDIDAQSQLDEIESAVSDAEAAVDSEEGEAELATIQELFEILQIGVEGGERIIRGGVEEVQAALEAQQRTSEHEVEIQFDQATAEIQNPEEVQGMLCGSLSELEQARGHVEAALGEFQGGLESLQTAQDRYTQIEREVEGMDEISTISINVAIAGPQQFAEQMIPVSEALGAFMDGMVGVNHGSMAWTVITSEMSEAYECSNSDYAVEGEPDPDAAVRDKYSAAAESYGTTNDVLGDVNTEPLTEEIVSIQQVYSCLAGELATATEFRLAAVDAWYDDDLQGYADELRSAIETEEGAGETCQ